ncbi:hypothetical protein M3Y99_01239200 [Aphelenchoides fujianensis]|nr:hypothetical protein M3Y99_01239200 [Aphelenchoides fujianensis]
MPFLRLNFSTYDSALLFQQNVNQTLARIHFPTQVINAFFDLRRETSQKTWRQLLYGVHVVFTFFLLIVVIGILVVEPYSIVRYDPLKSSIHGVLSAYFIKCQGFTSIVFLLAWNLRARSSLFHSRLMETSSGAGVLRKAKILQSINYMLVVYNVFRILLSVGIAVLRKWNANEEFAYYGSTEVLSWQTVGAAIFNGVVCGVAHLTATSLVFTHTGIVRSEFIVLAEDFRTDVNNNQLPVVNHYTFAYKNLIGLYKIIHLSLGVWINLQLCFSFVQLFYVVSILDVFSPWPETVVCLLLMVDSLIASMMHAVLIAKLYDSFAALPTAVLGLAVSGQVLNEGTYALINTFVAYTSQKHWRVYFVFGLFSISVRMLARLYIVIIVIALWGRFQSDNMLVTVEEIN